MRPLLPRDRQDTVVTCQGARWRYVTEAKIDGVWCAWLTEPGGIHSRFVVLDEVLFDDGVSASAD